MKKFIIILALFFCTATNILADNNIIKIPNISKADALKSAIQYVNENYPDSIDEINTETGYKISYNKTFPYGYNITFQRYLHNIPYSGDNIFVYVDSDSGEVLNSYIDFSNDYILSENSILIDTATANHQFINAYGLELRYNKRIDEDGINTYLTYTANDDFLINAETGNIITQQYTLPFDGYFDINSMAEKTSINIDSATVLISTDVADDFARNIEEFDISDNYNLVSADYMQSLDGSYLTTLTYTYGTNKKTVTLDAKNGNPIEYIDNSATNTSSKKDDQASKINELAEKYFSNYIVNTNKYQTITNDYTVILFERLVNDIPYKSNGLYICYDNYGNLKHLSFAWDNVEFASTSNIISLDDAYKVFFRKNALELGYFKRNTNILTPVYQISSNGTGIIDAISGRQLNYDGTLYYSEKDNNYQDINTHYAQYAARRLSDCDIYVSSGDVWLENYITQQEYLLLLCELIEGTKPVLNTSGILSDDQNEMLYKYMQTNRVIEKDEIDFYHYVTREDAVKYMLRVLGYGTVGDMKEIFISHFNDHESISDDLIGYVELARGLGIINGDLDNNFNPNDYITYGDSLIMVYNYLNR